jgi:hypothetical protein
LRFQRDDHLARPKFETEGKDYPSRRAIVMRELSAAIILFTSQTKVISVLIYDLNESGDLAAIAVLGIAMLVITFCGARRQPHPGVRRQRWGAAAELEARTSLARSQMRIDARGSGLDA